MRLPRILFAAAFGSFFAANLIHNRWGVDSALIPGVLFGVLYFRKPAKWTAFLAALGIAGPALAFFRWIALASTDPWYVVNHAFLLGAWAFGIAALVVALRPPFAAIHRAANIAIIAGSALQFYAVGLVMFGAASMQSHRAIGSALILLGLASWLAAQAAGRDKARPAAAFLVFVLLFLQPAIAFGLRNVSPAAAALHALNGLAILALAVRLEFLRRRSSDAPALIPPPQPAVSRPS
jgi:hypothetical protein